MSLQKLKATIIQTVSDSEDAAALEQIAQMVHELLELPAPETGLTNEEWAAVQEGEAQLAAGLGLDGKEVFKGIREKLAMKERQKA
jgi:hypothetical protein